jgi:RNA polymerase sigma factor (sigma-70 family)
MTRWTGTYWHESAFHLGRNLARFLSPIPNLNDFLHPDAPLPKEVEVQVFRQMNAIKYGLAKGVIGEEYQTTLKELRDFVGQRFFWLLVSWVDRIGRQCVYVDRDQLQSAAGQVLVQCMVRFNYRRGRRFSTYVSAALRNYLWDDVYAQKKTRERVQELNDDTDIVDPSRRRRVSKMQKTMLREQLNKLSKIERMVVVRRFGIGHPCDLTFEAISRDIGLARKAVNAIYDRAMKKLKNGNGEV